MNICGSYELCGWMVVGQVGPFRWTDPWETWEMQCECHGNTFHKSPYDWCCSMTHEIHETVGDNHKWLVTQPWSSLSGAFSQADHGQLSVAPGGISGTHRDGISRDMTGKVLTTNQRFDKSGMNFSWPVTMPRSRYNTAFLLMVGEVSIPRWWLFGMIVKDKLTSIDKTIQDHITWIW